MSDTCEYRVSLNYRTFIVGGGSDRAQMSLADKKESKSDTIVLSRMYIYIGFDLAVFAASNVYARANTRRTRD